jgi:hypothetical protein
MEFRDLRPNLHFFGVQNPTRHFSQSNFWFFGFSLDTKGGTQKHKVIPGMILTGKMVFLMLT